MPEGILNLKKCNRFLLSVSKCFHFSIIWYPEVWAMYVVSLEILGFAVRNLVVIIEFVLTLDMFVFLGSSTNTHDSNEAARSLATNQAGVETQQQPTERTVTSVLTLSDSRESSTSDSSTSSGSNKKTSPPPTSQPAALSADSLSSSSTLPCKKASASGVLQHQAGAACVLPASSTLCVNDMHNGTEGMASVGPAVTGADRSDSGDNSATSTDRLLLVRPQTVTVGRQKSEDDLEHMQEVADDLVAKLMDEEEGQEKLVTSLQQSPVAEKWYYRDPQGEVQGWCYSVW